MNYNTRKMRDIGQQGTEAWLSAWLDDDEVKLTIDRIAIPCVDLPKLPNAELAQYACFRSGNQSELHSYLKFAAFKWLLGVSSSPASVRAEVICYSPDQRLCQGIRSFDADGTEFDIRSPQVLPEASIFPLSYGDSIRVDLHASDISVEIGGTHPFNLLLPVLEGLSERALWIPYPCNTSTKDFDVCHGLGPVNGYMVNIELLDNA